MITVAGLAKSFGAKTLFEGVSLQLNAGCRYGLVGANGSGKSTFLRILTGEEEASAGTVSLPRKASVGVLRQDHFLLEDVPIVDVVMMGHEELWAALKEKDEVLARADEHFDGERYAELEDVVLRHDGYSFEARAAEILEGLGIPTSVHRRPLSTLSGGFKLRVLLAQTLAAAPSTLLLDEPTNHLDILSIRWLERFLSGYPGCAVVISHDHRFLDNVCTHILDVDYETILQYTGAYAEFTAQKQAERERKEAEIAKREKQIADRQAFVERFRAKATKARQAQSKMKQIDRIVIDRLPPSSRRWPSFRLSQCRPSGKIALELEGIGKSYGDNTVLSGVSLTVQRGDRLAIIGPNGIGKSTLLKIAVGELPPDRGQVQWGYETYPGYFAQDHHESLSDGAVTVQDWLWEVCPGQSIGYVRSQLARVLFSGEEVEKKVGQLSGGEASRLVLARLVEERPNVLVLDEPTNHLDLEAIESLVEGLGRYDGTLIFVSHDRWFVSRLATRVLEITAEGINDFPGTYDDYLERCGDDHLDAEAVLLRVRRERRRERGRAETTTDTPPDGRERDLTRRRRELGLRREVVTAGIEAAERRIAEIDGQFCEPGFFDRVSETALKRMQLEQRERRSEVERLMAEWETLEAELEG